MTGTLRKLQRDYSSIEGAPVLSAVDVRVFELRYFAHCMECGFCKDACCSYGVDVDADNVQRILAHRSALEPRLGVPADEWFEREVEADREFPSGRRVRTAVREGRCVFARRGGRGCELHAYALEHGLAHRMLKPLVSSLFPLTFDAGVLLPSSEALDRSLVCSGQGPTLYDGARTELAHYFGPALVAELDLLRATLTLRVYSHDPR